MTRFSTGCRPSPVKKVARFMAGEVLCRHCLTYQKVGHIPGVPNASHWRKCGEAMAEARSKGWLR